MHTSATVHFTNERNQRQPTTRNMHLDAHNNSGTRELCIPAVAQNEVTKSHWCQRTSRCPRPTSGHPSQRSSDRSALEPSHCIVPLSHERLMPSANMWRSRKGTAKRRARPHARGLFLFHQFENDMFEECWRLSVTTRKHLRIHYPCVRPR